MDIYLIDDNEIDLIVEKKLLELADPSLSISVCQSSVEALSNLMNKTIQSEVIILDWHMAELEAEDWLRYYTRQVEKLVPVYILTASINPQDRQKAEEFEVVQGFFIKPFSKADIDEVLHASSGMKRRKVEAN